MEARRVIAAVLVMFCICDLPIQPRTLCTGFPLGVTAATDDRLQHPDVSNLLKYSSCADFLLNGEIQVSEVLDGGTFGWRNGEWFVAQEASNPAAQSWLLGDTANDFPSVNGIADFEVSRSSDKWEGWRPPSIPDSLLHNIDGVLTLSSSEEFGKKLLQLIYLQGASIETEADRRLCMLGCATKPFPFQNQSKESSQEASEFLVKVRYPKHHTIMSRQVEAEVTSLRISEDPTHSPRFSILGTSPNAEIYEFQLKIPELLAGGNIKKTIDDIAPKSVSYATPEQLKKYLESAGQRRWLMGVSVSSMEQNLIQRQGTVQVGPFHVAQIQPRKDLVVFGVRVHMDFQRVLCRPNTRVGSKSILVTALMHTLFIVEQESLHGTFERSSSNLQQIFSVEGDWNPVSAELCMLGCGEMLSRNMSDPTYMSSTYQQKISLSEFLGAGCTWKICLQSVLRNYVDMNSPQGAILSSLREPGHPDHFAPLKMTQSLTFSAETDDFRYPTEYQYTRVSQAMDLAHANRAADGALVKFIDDHRLMFPTTKEGDLCSSIMELTMDLGLAEEVSLNDFSATYILIFDITNFESCASSSIKKPFGYIGDGDRSINKPKMYPLGTYLNVAGRFRIINLSSRGGSWILAPEMIYGPGYPAEGVYEPHTGLMHLVVNYPLVVEEGDFTLNRVTNVDQTTVADLDREIYMKIQYPPSNPMSSRQRVVQVQMQSLRKSSDHLYFPTLKLKGVRSRLYPSEVLVRRGVYVKGYVQGILVETIILVSLMRQITYNRRNNDNSTPYVSIVMLGLQAVFQLGRSLTFTFTVNMFQRHSWTRFYELRLAMKVLTLVEALLLCVLVYRVLKARAARLKINAVTSGKGIQMIRPASERRTLALSTVAFGVAFVVAVLNEWAAYELWVSKEPIQFDYEQMWLLQFLPISRWWIIRGLARFVNLVQQFYLVPQVIANILCDLKEAKPLSPAFILGPSLGYMICYLDDIYTHFHVGPELVAETTSRSFIFTSIGFSDVLPPIAKLGAVTCIFSLAVIAHIQQKHGARLGFFRSKSAGTPVGCEADDFIIKGAVSVQHEDEASDCELQ